MTFSVVNYSRSTDTFPKHFDIFDLSYRRETMTMVATFSLGKHSFEPLRIACNKLFKAGVEQ